MDSVFKYFKFFSTLLCLIPTLLTAAPELKPLHIAILQIIEHPALNATRQGIYDELKSKGYVEGKNLTWSYRCAQGKPLLASQIAQKFVSQQVDVIIALGTSAAQAAKQATRGTGILVVFSSITDPLGARLVTDLKHPDEHVTGVSNFIDVQPQLALFQQLLPHLTKLGFIYNPGEDNMVTLVKKVKEAAGPLGLKIQLQTADKTSDVAGAARVLVGMVDAIFISNDNTALAAFPSIVKAANQQKTPVFVSDTDLIDQGALAALGPDQYQLGKQTTTLLLKALADPHHLPAVEFPERTVLKINDKVAKKFKIQVPSGVMEHKSR